MARKITLTSTELSWHRKLIEIYFFVSTCLALESIVGMIVELKKWFHNDTLNTVEGLFSLLWVAVSFFIIYYFLYAYIQTNFIRLVFFFSPLSLVLYTIANYLCTPDDQFTVELSTATIAFLIFMTVYGLFNTWCWYKVRYRTG